MGFAVRGGVVDFSNPPPSLFLFPTSGQAERDAEMARIKAERDAEEARLRAEREAERERQVPHATPCDCYWGSAPSPPR